MRLWCVDTVIMCRKHLLGEHVELHMMIGSIKKNKNIDGYLAKGLIDISKIITRHKEIVKEMRARNYSHKSEIDLDDKITVIEYFCSIDFCGFIDTNKNLNTLLNRCEECRKQHDTMKGEL